MERTAESNIRRHVGRLKTEKLAAKLAKQEVSGGGAASGTEPR